MAKLLDYIAKKIKNLQSTLDDEKVLQKEGLFEVTEYIARNANQIIGGSSPYVNSGDPLNFDSLLPGNYGISVEYLTAVKKEADKRGINTQTKKDEKLPYFIDKTCPNADKEIKKVYEKLFSSTDFNTLIPAFCNVINYKVLTNYNTTLLEPADDGLGPLAKINNTLTYKSLPYGNIPTLIQTDLYYKKDTNTLDVVELCKWLYPYNANFTNIDPTKGQKDFKCIVNKEERFVRIQYATTMKSRGLINNDKLDFNNFPSDDSCKILSLKTETEKSYFNDFFNKSTISKDATKFEVLPSSGDEVCSTEDLDRINQEIDFVSKLDTNENFVKVKGVDGKQFLSQIETLNLISKNLPDNLRGLKSISAKCVFDKRLDIFANVRVTELYSSLFVATYGDDAGDLVDIYYANNPEGKSDIYIVNKNNRQFGYLQTIIETQASNCSTSVYIELLKPALSIKDKYELFQEENIRPIILKDGVVEKTEGLEDAQLRQSYLLTITDKEVFYDLFIRNIMAYVYGYASQVEKKVDEKSDKTKLVWVTNKNDKWGEGEFGPNKLGQLQWSQPDYYYIYDVRETFWMNNQEMSIKEVLAFFVSKGGSRYDNSSYYRKLCTRILGVDYYLFSKQIIPNLLDDGVLCIEDLKFDSNTGELKNVKYAYVHDYTKGDVYRKLDKLNTDLGQNIYLLFGTNKGAEIIDRQETLLEKAKPKLVTFGNKEKSLNLTVSIHNPIFFNAREGFVNRVGQNLGLFNDGKTAISSYGREKYKPIDVDNTERLNYQNYQKNKPFGSKVTNHLYKFYEYMKFGSGGGKISKGYISEEYIIQGYIFPLKYDEFITKFLLKSFSGKVDGKNEKLPLSFIKDIDKKYQIWTRTNVFNDKSKSKFIVGNSFLSRDARLNLQKAGFISKNAPTETIEYEIDTGKKKKDGTPIMRKKKVDFLVISEEEGKRIYDTVLAKYNKLESEIKVEGDRLFTLFCQTQLEPEYRKKIENDWNATYNGMAPGNISKFPIFCEHSRWFGDLPKPFLFGLREAQVEGMKFAVANKNSGLLAHEVGFGKTTTSIAMMSHMILTGESPRTIVFTPAQVYEKFYDEITGRQETGVLGLLGNWKNPFPVMKLGNASANTLTGGSNFNSYKALKDYSTDEKIIMNKWKDLTKAADTNKNKEQRNRFLGIVKQSLSNLPKGQAKFFPKEYVNRDITKRIEDRSLNSNVDDWFSKFTQDVEQYIPEVRNSSNINSVYGQMIDIIQNEIDKSTFELEDLISKYETAGRYTKETIKKPNVPPSIQEWWRKNKNRVNPPVNSNIRKLEQYDYPQRYWIDNIDDALKDGVINQAQADNLKLQEKQGKSWTGVLSADGMVEVKKQEALISQRFFHLKDKTGRIIRLVNSISKILADELGKYKEQYKQPNQIILCNHGAISRFRVSEKSRNEAKMFVSNVDSVDYVQNNVDKVYDNLSLQPLSLTKLNVTGVVVDEIHNFNNLISKPRNRILAMIAETSGGSSRNGDFNLFPTRSSNALITKSPTGDSINTKSGRTFYKKTPTGTETTTENSYRIKFNSTGKGSLKVGPTNLLAIIMEIKNNSKLRGLDENNTIMMSATPFTDNVFQMFTVFGFVNRDMLRQANMDKVFDFFITFVKEEWRFNITHQNQFGLFAEIQGYYNTFAMSNLIKCFANFKVSDKIIEASRPLKYLIPQEKGMKNQSGSNSSSVQYSSLLEEVESYVELSSVQKEIVKKLAEFVEGKSNSAYTICPNYGDVVKVSDAGELVFANEEVDKQFSKVQKLIREARKLSEDQEKQTEKLEEAVEIIDLLRDDYPKDKRINRERDKIYDLLYGDISERDETAFITSEEDIDFLVEDEEQRVLARAIIGQSKGQACVISPYLLPCDEDGKLENALLKSYPLKKDDMSLSAKNFVEQSPKIRYAVENALNSITYDANNRDNFSQIGGQIIYLDRGKNFRYGGGTYNAYDLIKKYIVDKNFSYTNATTGKTETLGEDEIAIITGGMGSTGAREDIRDKFNDGRVKILLGSSAIKEGIDLNRRAHTLYILDSDFSPSNAMQLEGRIWRQKNAWKYVRIVYVLGRDSIDAFVYSKLQQKIGEIKKMLEAGVYELNRTQFTINAKERIRKIISDVDQLAELEWQDRQDELNRKLGEEEIDKSKLTALKQSYIDTKQDFDTYVVFINQLYSLLEDDAIENIAKEYKLDQDILMEHRHRIKGAKEGEMWRKENPFKPMSIDVAKQVIRTEYEEGKIETGIPQITLNSNSKMEEVNQVVERVSSFVKSKKNELGNIISLNEYDRENIFRGDKLSQAAKLAKKLFSIKKWEAYDQVMNYVNLFAKGSPNETIMSDYDYLVSNQKDENENFYSYDDLDRLINERQNNINDFKRELDNEDKFKTKEKELIRINQEKTKKIVGSTLDEQIQNFKKSMALLEWRKDK